MKKLFFTLIGTIVLTVANDRAFCMPMSEYYEVQLQEGTPDPNDDDRPRTGLSFYSAIDTDMSLFLISVASDCGDVSLVLENQITGEYYSTSFDYYHPLSIPLMSVSGWWTVTLTLESGIIYYGEVEI